MKEKVKTIIIIILLCILVSHSTNAENSLESTGRIIINNPTTGEEEIIFDYADQNRLKDSININTDKILSLEEFKNQQIEKNEKFKEDIEGLDNSLGGLEFTVIDGQPQWKERGADTFNPFKYDSSYKLCMVTNKTSSDVAETFTPTTTGLYKIYGSRGSANTTINVLQDTTIVFTTSLTTDAGIIKYIGDISLEAGKEYKLVIKGLGNTSTPANAFVFYDSLIPSKTDSKIIYLGTGTSFDVSNYSGYENFTVDDNFIICVSNVKVSIADNGGNLNGSISSANFNTTPKTTYDASTGILTVSGLSASKSTNFNAFDYKRACKMTSSITYPKVYLVLSGVN